MGNVRIGMGIPYACVNELRVRRAPGTRRTWIEEYRFETVARCG